MRVLFYGGCHARVLRDIFRRWAVHPALEVEDLINFQLIMAGTPFPYDDLRRYDAVAFSPIEHKEGYNTADLLRYCTAHGIQAVSFPWMEWHGYHPRSSKGPFWGHRQWFYPELLQHRAAFRRFDDFVEFVEAEYPGPQVIDDVRDATTAHITATEQRTGTDIRMSGVIDASFRTQRLFLLPDHPSRHLYVVMATRLAALLGLELDPGFALSEAEPQEGWRTPVLPAVVRRLGLGFDGPAWQDIDWFADGVRFDLRQYLHLYFAAEQGHAVATARIPAQLVPTGGGATAAVRVQPGERLLLAPLRRLGQDLAEAEVLCTLGQTDAAVRSGGAYRLNPAEWVLEGYSGT